MHTLGLRMLDPARLMHRLGTRGMMWCVFNRRHTHAPWQTPSQNHTTTVPSCNGLGALCCFVGCAAAL
jgi:hypothetical protein